MFVFLLLAFRQGAVTDVGMKVATTGELGSEGCAFKSPEGTQKTVVFHCSKSCRCFPKSRICQILFGPQMSHWKPGIAPFILCCSNNLKRTENNSVHFLGLGKVNLATCVSAIGMAKPKGFYLLGCSNNQDCASQSMFRGVSLTAPDTAVFHPLTRG